MAWCVCIYVAVANKVGGTRIMSWCQEPVIVSVIHTQLAVCMRLLYNPCALWLIQFFSWSAILRAVVCLPENITEPMRFWHLNMTLLRVKQGHFETAILFFSIFRLLLRLKVFRSITSRFLYDLNIEYGDANFGMGAAWIRYFWPNSAIAVNGTTHVYHNLWVLFLLFQGRV